MKRPMCMMMVALMAAMGGARARSLRTARSCPTFSLTINTDNYADETSWALEKDGSSVASDSLTYSQSNSVVTHSEPLCDSGTYKFTINDVYGDGLTYTGGSYTVKLDGSTLKTGSAFGYEESFTFEVDNGDSPPPTSGGRRVPGEFEPNSQRSVYMQWPRGYEASYRANFAGILQALVEESGLEIYVICRNNREVRSAKRFLNNRVPSSVAAGIRWVKKGTNNAWPRDNGAVWVEETDSSGTKKLIAQDWKFDAWGGLEGASFAKDDVIPPFQAQLEGVHVEDKNAAMVMERGNLEFNGQGALITSWPCNKDRNPSMSRAQMEAEFRAAWGVTQIVWLEDVPPSDEVTKGHTDGIARFIGPNHVLVAQSTSNDDPDKEAFDNSARIIAAAGFRVTRMPTGGWFRYGGADLTANYVNFLIAGDAVVMPSFNKPTQDNAARAKIQSLFPDLTVVSVDSRELWLNGGSVHCVTNDVPRKP